jgi:hypothetical protein
MRSRDVSHGAEEGDRATVGAQRWVYHRLTTMSRSHHDEKLALLRELGAEFMANLATEDPVAIRALSGADSASRSRRPTRVELGLPR